MAKPVRFAVIGLGLMGERHCRVITAIEGASLAGVCDHQIEKAQELANQFETKVFANYNEVLKTPDIDAVVLCIPSGIHGEYGIEAAKVGKHVIVEKPLDSRSIEAEKLAAACREAGVICAVISQNRYSDGIRQMKMALETGLLGLPVLTRATVKWFRHDEYYQDSPWRGRRSGEYGGVLINQAVHSIDTLLWLFGEPKDISGYTNCSRPGVMETEDSAVAIFRWESGLLGTLEASTHAAPGFDEEYEIHSPTASIKVTKGRVTYWHHAAGLDLPDVRNDSSNNVLSFKLNLFARQYCNIVNVITGKEELDIKPEEAINVIKTIEKIYESHPKPNCLIAYYRGLI